jgi:hypothetical protein
MGASGRAAAAVLAAPVVLAGALLAVPVLAVAAAGRETAPAGGAVAGIPARVLAAYRAADGWCPGLRWQLLAAIGATESGHGTTGGAGADPDTGVVRPPVFGPPLDGTRGTRRLPVGPWLGWAGLAGPWQQAVGPMQFLPATFSAVAADGDGDGVADPHDIDDAVATAARYLCGEATTPMVDERSALLRYNRDGAYADRVLAAAQAFGVGAAGPINCPVAGPMRVTDTWGTPRPGGRRHRGIDLAAPHNTPVVAPVAGEVAFGEDPAGGLGFHLWGDDGAYYYGAHLAGFATRPGRVAAGDVIAYVGSTGRSTGPHLHFEVHPDRRRGAPPNPVDPSAMVEPSCARGDPVQP